MQGGDALNIIIEIEFWTQIMRDHSTFLLEGLSFEEKELISKTKDFFETFDDLYKGAQQLPEELTPEVIPMLIVENKTVIVQFIQFKKEILEGIMASKFKIAYSPSFLNALINEAMEFYRVLCIADDNLRYNRVLENIRMHRIWLMDATNHAWFIAAEIDPIEKQYIKQAIKFHYCFSKLFKKGYELYLMYERITRKNGELEHFNNEVEDEINKFIGFLKTIEKVKDKKQILTSGLLSTLSINHMIREEEYYLSRIKELYKRKK